VMQGGDTFACPADLWSRNYGAVAGNDLRLKRENFAAIRIHQHLYPMNVIVVVGVGVGIGCGERVVTKGFDAEVLSKILGEMSWLR